MKKQVENPCPSEMDLAAYAEKNVTADERKKIERHLVSCFSCYESVVGAIKPPPDIPPSPHLTRWAKALSWIGGPTPPPVEPHDILLMYELVTASVEASKEVMKYALFVSQTVHWASLQSRGIYGGTLPIKRSGSDDNLIVLTRDFTDCSVQLEMAKEMEVSKDVMTPHCQITLQVRSRRRQQVIKDIGFEGLEVDPEASDLTLGRYVFDNVELGIHDVKIKKGEDEIAAFRLNIQKKKTAEQGENI